MDRQQIAVTAIALMRDSVHSEVELLGAEFKKLIEPVMGHVLSENSGMTDESREVFRAAFEGIARKMIDFVDAISATEQMANAALEGMGYGSVQIQALVQDDDGKKIVSKPIRKAGKIMQDPKYKKGFSGRDAS